jgi:hypothetical protein
MYDLGSKSEGQPGAIGRALAKLTVGSNGVVELSRGVLDQVQGPAKELVHEHVEELSDGSVLDGFSEFSLSESGDAGDQHKYNPMIALDSIDTLNLLLVLGSGVTHLRSSSGNKDLVSGHVTGGGVMLTVLLRQYTSRQRG